MLLARSFCTRTLQPTPPYDKQKELPQSKIAPYKLKLELNNLFISKNLAIEILRRMFMKNKGGRPTKLTTELQNQIYELFMTK